MKNEIVKKIQGISGNYNPHEMFGDWVKASAICISNSMDNIHSDIYTRRESEYMEIVNKHGADKMQVFSEMLGMLTVCLEHDMQDALGNIYMMIGLGSKQTGQFFTPYHISVLIANMVLDTSRDKVVLNEPSSGGGGMIIAAASVIKKAGRNYQKILDVTAQDLDWRGVYMTYVQLSLLGIKAKVIQGDTLAATKPSAHQIYYTPTYKGAIL